MVANCWKWSQKNFWLLVIAGLTIYGFFRLATNNFGCCENEPFVHLANSFLNKQLNLPTYLYDSAVYQNRFYWPLGPMPAVVLMPIVYFSTSIRLGGISIVIALFNFYLLYNIAQKNHLKKESSLWLAFAYMFSTAYIGIALVPGAHYFAQVVATSFMLLALNEFFGKKRLLLVGAFLGFATLTRITLILSSIFFILMLIHQKALPKHRFKEIALLSTPIVLCLALYGFYNFFRFHSFFEVGYSYQVLNIQMIQNNYNMGQWSFVHFPANLYYLFLKGPEAVFIPGTKVMASPYITADRWGMGIVFTSPIFLYLLKRKKDFQSLTALVTVFLMLLPLLGYYGIGVKQYGYRYALDFYPFLFIALLPIFKDKLSTFAKILIIVSLFWNFYLFPSAFA